MTDGSIEPTAEEVEAVVAVIFPFMAYGPEETRKCAIEALKAVDLVRQAIRLDKDECVPSEEEVEAGLNAANINVGCIIAISRNRLVAAFRAAARVRQEAARDRG